MKETPEEYFFRLLVEGKLDFLKLLNIYVAYLEEVKRDNRRKIVDAGFLLAVFQKPKLWKGTKIALKRKLQKAIDDAEIFDK